MTSSLLDRPAPAAPAAVRRRPSRRVRWLVVVLGLVAGVVLLARSTGGRSHDSTADTSARAAAGTSSSTAALAGPAVPAAPVDTPPAGTPMVGKRIVKTGQVQLRTGSGRVPATLTAVQQAAEALGGQVATSSTQESGTAPSGSITVRVPVAQFGALLLKVRSLDATVTTAQISSNDVTAQSVDLDAQVQTLRETRDQLLVIKAEAREVADILTVQQRIDDVTARVNAAQAQAAVLRGQASMSTLSVDVQEGAAAARRARADGGLGQAFRDARHSFGSGVEWLVRHSGGVLLLLVCALLLLPLGLLGRRLARRRAA